MDSEFRPIFPSMPHEMPVIDKNGNLNPMWLIGFAQLFQALQINFKNEGILVPRLNASQINDIEATYASLIGSPLPPGVQDISGQLVFDITNGVSKQFVITYNTATPYEILSAQWRTIQYV